MDLIRKTVLIVILTAALALAPAAAMSAPGGGTSPGGPAGKQGNSPFERPSMWIWYVSKSGGSAEKIAAKAQQYGIETVFIKSADGGGEWSQFAPIVDELQSLGLKVCGWQYTYGRNPIKEARMLARAASYGADCVIIDAEGEYEGHYKAARRYMIELRKRVGANFPVAMSSFPYVFYHQSFPYSAFFAPPYGAQYNIPQVYFKAIGHPVAKSMNLSYTWNNPYDVPIAPAAGTWLGESGKQIKDFRRLASRYGSGGTSYWAWQFTRSWQWLAIAAPLERPDSGALFPKHYPQIGPGNSGDTVVWLQIQLREWGYKVKRSGYYRQATVDAVEQFQSGHSLNPSGKMDDETWEAVLDAPGSSAGGPGNGGVKASVASAGIKNDFNQPASAKLKARYYELPPIWQRR